MQDKKRHLNKGVTLVEAVVGIAVFTTVAVGVYSSYSKISEIINASRLKAVAVSVINDDIELARNLPYQDVGIQGGHPPGTLVQTAIMPRSGYEFLLTRTVRNIDNPFDGTIGGAPNDTAPADYKLLEIEALCTNCRSAQPIKLTTTVAPKNLEISSGGGALFVQVIDANGVGVPQANVHVENKKLTPNVIIDDVTNNQGMLQLVDVSPSVGGYNSRATKTGYSIDQTYPPGGSDNPNPVKTDSTVAAGQVTQVTLAIDRVSRINVSTTNQICQAVPDVSFRADGAKLIGTIPNILKYSQATTTDADGRRVLENLEWDTYDVTVTDANYHLAGSIPLLPITISPHTTQNLQLLVNAKDPKSFLVTVKDSATKLPVTGAIVTLEKGAFSAQAITGRGSLVQTDWSGGAGQAAFIDPARFYDSDGNIDISGPGGEIKLVRSFGDYVASGWLESSTFDLGSASDFHTISWLPQDQPLEAGPDSVKFQTASNNDNATWNFVGPDGTASSYYTLSNTNISNHSGKRYFRYKIFLSTMDPQKTPNVSDISFTFTTPCVPPGQVFFNALSSGTYTLTVTHPNYQTWLNDEIQISSDFSAQEVLLNP